MTLMENQNNIVPAKRIIKCPHCGYEYLIDEIFMPSDLMGKSTGIIRDALGKILYSEYKEEPIMTQSYICDHCNRQFVVEATLTLKEKEEEEEKDFSQPYVSLL